MLKTSLVLSMLSAMLSVEGSSKSLEQITPTKVPEAASAVDIEKTDKHRIEAEARQNVAQSLINE
jgi:hypothetical protein